MKTRHIILRAGRAATRDLYGPTMAAPAAGTPGTHAIVQVDEVDRKDLARLAQAADVVAIAPAMPMRLIAPRDVHDALPAEAGDTTWGVAAVRADTSPYSGEGAVVAVLDTGIQTDHPAFAGVQLVQRNFTGESPQDQHGHGTHCAGTIFGRRVGSTRIGVAPGVRKALIGKVLGADGGSSEAIASAIQWADEEGAHVISMSLGMDFPGYARALEQQEGLPTEIAVSRALEGYRANVKLFERLADYLRARPVPTLIVAAAGNESQVDIDPRYEVAVAPPAVAEGIVSVAALGKRPSGLGVAPFSNTGANVAAPGVAIVSARRGGGLATMSGTSMATPHVAGVAALWVECLRKQGTLSTLTLLAKLIGSTTTQGLAPGTDPFDVGAGLVIAPQL